MIIQSERPMTMDELKDEYIRLLEEANNEDRTQRQHEDAVCTLRAWLSGVHAGTGFSFNGDYHYLDCDRPRCVGQLLDWKSKL